MAKTLPVLDISRFDRAAPDREVFLAEVRQAAYDPGFFYLTGHGVPRAQCPVARRSG